MSTGRGCKVFDINPIGEEGDEGADFGAMERIDEVNVMATRRQRCSHFLKGQRIREEHSQWDTLALQPFNCLAYHVYLLHAGGSKNMGQGISQSGLHLWSTRRENS